MHQFHTRGAVVGPFHPEQVEYPGAGGGERSGATMGVNNDSKEAERVFSSRFPPVTSSTHFFWCGEDRYSIIKGYILKKTGVTSIYKNIWYDMIDIMNSYRGKLPDGNLRSGYRESMSSISFCVIVAGLINYIIKIEIIISIIFLFYLLWLRSNNSTGHSAYKMDVSHYKRKPSGLWKALQKQAGKKVACRLWDRVTTIDQYIFHVWLCLKSFYLIFEMTLLILEF